MTAGIDPLAAGIDPLAMKSDGVVNDMLVVIVSPTVAVPAGEPKKYVMWGFARLTKHPNKGPNQV